MSLTITFSEELAEKIQRLATLRHQNVDHLFETLIEEALPDQRDIAFVQANGDAEATPEMKSFLALHPLLKKKDPGEYVAIFQGKLIDHNQNYEALYQRIDAHYPNDFVWISPVEEEAILTLTFRSPRFEWADAA